GNAPAGRLHDAGADANAAGAAGLRRSIADVDPAGERPVDELIGPGAGADQHEIGTAPPVRQPEPIARLIQQLSGFRYLSQVLLHMIEIAERRLDGGRSRDVDAV